MLTIQQASWHTGYVLFLSNTALVAGVIRLKLILIKLAEHFYKQSCLLIRSKHIWTSKGLAGRCRCTPVFDKCMTLGLQYHNISLKTHCQKPTSVYMYNNTWGSKLTTFNVKFRHVQNSTSCTNIANAWLSSFWDVINMHWLAVSLVDKLQNAPL